METLHVLEAKIASLIELIKKLRSENEDFRAGIVKLEEDNARLALQLKSVKVEAVRVKEEEDLAKSVVDDLIKSIDSLVENECQ